MNSRAEGNVPVPSRSKNPGQAFRHLWPGFLFLPCERGSISKWALTQFGPPDALSGTAGVQSTVSASMTRSLLLSSRRDDFTAYDETNRCGSDDIPFAIVANDNLPRKTRLSDRFRALVHYLIPLASAH